MKLVGVLFGFFFGKVKNGENVILEDGREIIVKDYIFELKKGKVIIILGDIRKIDVSIRLVLGVDVLVYEFIYGKGDEWIVKLYGYLINM